ncbi:MAG: DNA mismatch repair endonuclease MutL [Acidobacteriia bacterium]|nr:DNA mismatch repair endonuclease MutL [Terriglobia bacterium]
MGRIHILPEHVANKIAAGEVVERPASVVKELLENALDAGARRIRVQVEGGGKKLIQVTDDGCGMVRDDALLAFERHATSKIRSADDLLTVATLGFRGEALPSIASVSRLRLETCAADSEPSPPYRSTSTALGAGSTGSDKGGATLVPSGTVVEIAGGKILRVEEAGLPAGTSITVRDLFFNVPARRKFLRSESTELAQIASLVTHYALAHPDKHFELHSSVNAMLIAAPVGSHQERIYQVFGRETLDQLLPLAAVLPLARVGLPQPPPWAKRDEDEPQEKFVPGELRLHGFVSKPEIQKLNRNSMFVFVNGRLIRDKVVQHALTESYRNILPPTVYPVVLLFLELPSTEVDVNVHPSKVEVRFRQGSVVHDFVRDSVRAALMKARPVPQFTREITAQPTASPGLTPGARFPESPHPVAPPRFASGQALPGATRVGHPGELGITQADADFALRAPTLPPVSQRLEFQGSIEVEGNAAVPVARFASQAVAPDGGCGRELADLPPSDAPPFESLKPLGQVRESFILAVNEEGLWIIDQHVAHERVLFEKVLRQRAAERVESQRLLMPLIVELSPQQQAIFAEICDELRHNGFDAEPFGSRTVAVKTAPAGVDAGDVERMLHELLTQFEREEQALNLEIARARIAASIACHAAIKINTPLTADKMEWLLRELAKTECPFSCPHGRPVVLRYSVRDIQKAFKRI